MVKNILTGLVAATLLIQGCATRQPLPEPELIENSVDFRTDWRRGVDGGFGESSERFSIVTENDDLYFVTDRGVVYQLNQETGRRVASMGTDKEVSAGVAKNDNLIFFGTYDAELVAVSLVDRNIAWTKQLTSEVLAEPAYMAHKLAVQTADGWLSLLDSNTGDTLWRVKEDLPALTVRGTSSPVIADGKVIAGFSDGKVKAFGLLNGKEVWSFDVGKAEGRYEIERLTDVDGRLVVDGNVVYATAYNGTVSALNITTGRPLWQRNIPSAVGVAVKNGVLAAVDMDSKVYALNAANGSELWTSMELEGRSLISPVFYREFVAVMDRGGYVHLLNSQTGKLEARKLADKDLPAGSRMVSNDKQLFILTNNEQVTALKY